MSVFVRAGSLGGKASLGQPKVHRREWAVTARQRECLDFLIRFTAKHGWPPTLREIGNAMGIKSTNGVSEHLDALEDKGLIVRGGEGRSRAIAVTEKGRAA